MKHNGMGLFTVLAVSAMFLAGCDEGDCRNGQGQKMACGHSGSAGGGGLFKSGGGGGGDAEGVARGGFGGTGEGGGHGGGGE